LFPRVPPGSGQIEPKAFFDPFADLGEDHPGFSPADVLDPICRRKTGTVRTAFGFVRGKKEGFSEVTGKEV